MIKRYEYNGQLLTARELSEATGVPYSTIGKRLCRTGGNVEESLRPTNKGGQIKLYEYKGEMLSLSEIGKLTGCPPKLIRDRIYKGWTVEAAADTAVSGRAAWKQRHAERVAQIKLMTANDSDKSPRTIAAESIAKTTITAPLQAFNFKCIIPSLEYAFDTDQLEYRIRFGNESDVCTATLTAIYKINGAPSSLNRVYNVRKSKIKEVHASWEKSI